MKHLFSNLTHKIEDDLNNHNMASTVIVGYLIKGQHDVNLIGINWEKASITINYPGARKNVGIIGKYTANFIDFMVSYSELKHLKISKKNPMIHFKVENKMLKLSDLIVVGFSLGAHAAGFGKLILIYYLLIIT